MMSKPIVVSGELVGEDDLRQFLADTEKMLGAKIVITPLWQVSCDDASVMLALEALFGRPGARAYQEPESPVRKKLIQKGKQARRPVLSSVPTEDNPRLSKSWRVLDRLGNVLEYLTVDEKNRRLVEGGFDEGTILHHPKAGKQVVVGARGSGQGMKPLEA